MLCKTVLSIMQLQHKCFCATKLNPSQTPDTPTLCSIMCAGDPTQECGQFSGIVAAYSSECSSSAKIFSTFLAYCISCN